MHDAHRIKSVIKGIPVLDRIGNVLKHVLLLTEDKDKNTERSLTGEPEASASHKEEEDGELVKAFMTTDTSVADVPITETSPGFQVGNVCEVQVHCTKQSCRLIAEYD